MGNDGLAYLESLAQWKGQGGFGLGKIKQVLNKLGDPQDSFRSIHVAGTNGKGSVSVTLAAILGAAGYRVGLNTSPHIVTQNERVVIDGSPISDLELAQLSNEIKSASEGCGIELSYFEAMTAIGFLAFRAAEVDFGVIEVGLGGRLDATNVITHPECCAIVSIDFDHQALLGDTLEKIAAEKAGIIKEGVPVIVGNLSNGPAAVIASIAEAKSAPIEFLSRDFAVEIASHDQWSYHSDVRRLKLNFNLRGDHQAQNAAVAIRIAEHLGISNESIERGVSGVYWPARLESVHYKGHPIILDSAHNPAGIGSFISFLDKEKLTGLTLGFGAIVGKDWRFMVEALRPYVSKWCVMTPAYQDPIPSSEVCDYLSGIGVSSTDFGTNYTAFLESVKSSPAPETENRVAVVGSMYLIGIIRSFMDEPIGKLWQRRVGNAQPA